MHPAASARVLGADKRWLRPLKFACPTEERLLRGWELRVLFGGACTHVALARAAALLSARGGAALKPFWFPQALVAYHSMNAVPLPGGRKAVCALGPKLCFGHSAKKQSVFVCSSGFALRSWRGGSRGSGSFFSSPRTAEPCTACLRRPRGGLWPDLGRGEADYEKNPLWFEFCFPFPDQSKAVLGLVSVTFLRRGSSVGLLFSGLRKTKMLVFLFREANKIMSLNCFMNVG